ncbi:MAG: helix-turn-helix domain-containing protein, partial [Clostridiaceae bacterium]
ELENVIQYLITIADSGKITKAMVSEEILKSVADKGTVPEKQANQKPFRTLDEIETEEIERAVSYFGNTTEGKKKAAGALGIGIATLYRKLGNPYQNDNNNP